MKATLRVFFPRKNASQVKELFEALVRDPAIRRGERVNYRQLFDETPEGDQVRQPQAHTAAVLYSSHDAVSCHHSHPRKLGCWVGRLISWKLFAISTFRRFKIT